MKTEKIPISAETLIDLVRRMVALEARLDKVEKTAESNFQSLAEHIPNLVAGGVEVKAFDGKEDYVKVILKVADPEADRLLNKINSLLSEQQVKGGAT